MILRMLKMAVLVVLTATASCQSPEEDEKAAVGVEFFTNGQLNLSWQDNSTNETGFEVERATGSGGTFSKLATVGANVLAYTDSSPSASTNYCYRVRAFNSAGASAYTASACATTPTGGTVSTITAGETAVLSAGDSNNGDLLVAQETTLSQTAILRSLSFYVTTAAGSLRLGVYDSTGPGGGPGRKLAETASMTPISGWNTVNVSSPVTLLSGSYWLAYLPSSDALGFKKIGSSAGSVG